MELKKIIKTTIQEFLNENINIQQTISQMILDYKDVYNCSISDINNGMCDEFAEEIIEKLGGETDNLYILHSDEFYDEFMESNFDNSIFKII